MLLNAYQTALVAITGLAVAVSGLVWQSDGALATADS